MTAQESGAAAIALSHGWGPQSHTHFLRLWNSTCRFGTVFFTVAAVSLMTITSSFCLSFKTCTSYEISKMRMFLMLYKMEMGRFGWQGWPWQSCRGAVCWAMHKEELKFSVNGDGMGGGREAHNLCSASFGPSRKAKGAREFSEVPDDQEIVFLRASSFHLWAKGMRLCAFQSCFEGQKHPGQAHPVTSEAGFPQKIY